MKQLEVGMQITTKDQQTYRILAIMDQGRQYLAQADQKRGDGVRLIDATEIVQIAEQSSETTDVQLDTVAVVGQRYVEDVETTLATLHVGQAVLLQRESQNEHDPNAISVWTLDHAKLGYVARYQNQPYANLLDQQRLLYGTVTELDRERPSIQLQLWRVAAQPSPVAALRVRQQLANVAAQPALAPLPSKLITTPLGDLIVTCNGRPIPYQAVRLSPWLTAADELTVTQRYVITPDWQRVTDGSLVTCTTATAGQVIQRWQSEDNGAIVLTNATSFYVVGLSAMTKTGTNDNLAADAAETKAFYRVGEVAAHTHASFMVSWAPFGDPHVQPSLRAALTFPEPPLVPYAPLAASQEHATFTRQELAALLVSGLPNDQGGQILEPSVSDLTVEKLRVTLGDQAYHALANYHRRVQLLMGSLDGINPTLVQALIHAVVYHEITTLHYYAPTVGMVDQPIYPLQLFSTTAKDDDQRLIGCLAFYNYDTFELQQVPLTAIASLAVIADPEHPQKSSAAPNPDWRQIFLHSWNDN